LIIGDHRSGHNYNSDRKGGDQNENEIPVNGIRKNFRKRIFTYRFHIKPYLRHYQNKGEQQSFPFFIKKIRSQPVSFSGGNHFTYKKAGIA
jgi:hypothetical protein